MPLNALAISILEHVLWIASLLPIFLRFSVPRFLGRRFFAHEHSLLVAGEAVALHRAVF